MTKLDRSYPNPFLLHRSFFYPRYGAITITGSGIGTGIKIFGTEKPMPLKIEKTQFELKVTSKRIV